MNAHETFTKLVLYFKNPSSVAHCVQLNHLYEGHSPGCQFCGTLYILTSISWCLLSSSLHLNFSHQYLKFRPFPPGHTFFSLVQMNFQFLFSVLQINVLWVIPDYSASLNWSFEPENAVRSTSELLRVQNPTTVSIPQVRMSSPCLFWVLAAPPHSSLFYFCSLESVLNWATRHHWTKYFRSLHFPS